MTVVTGNNVNYGSGAFYDARIEYTIDYISDTQAEVHWEMYMHHQYSLYDSNNKGGCSAGSLKAATSFGSKSISHSGTSDVTYASGTKTVTRSYSGNTVLTQNFWVEGFADNSGGGARSTVTATITVTKRPADVPSKPANPTITAITQSGAKVNFVLPANNGAAIDQSRVRLYTALTGGTLVATNVAAPPSTSETFVGLTPGTQYFAQVEVHNSEGWSLPSTRVPFTTTVATAPNKPAAPTVGTITDTTAIVTMTNSTLNGATVLGYNVVVLSAAGSVVQDLTSTTLTKALAGLVIGTRYKVKFRINSTGGYSEFSNATDFHTTAIAPGVPLSLAAAVQPNGDVIFSWLPPASDGGLVIDKYTLLVDDTADFSSTLSSTEPTASPATISVLPHGVTLYAKLRAHTSFGYGDYCLPITFEIAGSGLDYNDADGWHKYELHYKDETGWHTCELWYNDELLDWEVSV